MAKRKQQRKKEDEEVLVDVVEARESAQDFFEENKIWILGGVGVLVLIVVPSVDTPVCATQMRKFNEKATGLSDDVVVLTVSMDLPFAQARF